MKSVRALVATAVALTATSVLAVAAPASVAHAATPVFINEIHYDNDGTDAGEGVEVAGPAGTDLSGWQLVPYNGNGGAAYTPIVNLSGSIDDEGGSGHGAIWFPLAGLQNGAPDGIALVNGTTVVQFLSYEGTFTASSGVAAGLTSTSLGVAQSGNEPIGLSLQLIGSGSDYDQFSWAAPSTASPGAVNAGQDFGAAPQAPTITDQPDSKTVLRGTSASLTVVATGDAPLAYQWYQDAEPDVLIDGAASATYDTPTSLAAGTYGYYVVVSNGVEPSATSDVATVTVTDTPDPLVASDPGDKTFFANQAITPFTLGASGGTAPYSFTVSPPLSAVGLSLDPATGEISGSPTATAPATDYTITVTDSADPAVTATEIFAITVTEPPAAPFISEIQYNPSGADTNEFVEVTAGAGTSFSGYQIVLYNGNGGAQYATYPLTGIATDEDDGYGAVDIATPGIQNGNPDGVALLTSGGELIEFLSYGGAMTASGGPAAGATSTDIGIVQSGSTPDTETLQKQAGGTWAGPMISNRGLPNGYPGWTPPLVALDSFDPTFVAGADINPFTLAATGGEEPYTFAVDILPAGLVLDPATGVITGTPTLAGTYPVTMTVSDSDDPADSDQESFTIRVVDEPATVTPIAEIQGTGPASPLAAGTVVKTEGVVTALYEVGGYDGFYIQTGGTGGPTDATAGASDGIFVYAYSSFGSSPDAAMLDLGDSVSVVGSVSEFFETTELTLLDLVELEAGLTPVTPLSLPWTSFDTAAEREAHEGELLAPAGDFTVTNAYGASGYAEIGLAAGTSPLMQPTDVADPQDAAAINAVIADNAARLITLDDGSSLNYSGNPHLPVPWYGADSPPRVGAAVTFAGSVILEYRNNMWKFQPTTPVRDATADGTGTVVFENTRTLAPGDVGGDIRLATFNVLNLFPTTGEEYENELGGSCSSFNDRFGNPITVDDCGASGPRGAWDEESLERQTAKIVVAINSLDASIVSLEELENSVRFGKDRDFAISYLVDELNEAAGAGTWAYVPSPAPDDLPLPHQEDVIRNGFIYKPADVQLVGESQVLVDEATFSNAREPLAQAFKAVGAPDAEAFVAIVNHFKSKGSSCGAASDDALQGNCNGDRIDQAEALVAFADAVRESIGGSGAVFLLGDFNSYTYEDPMDVFYEAGYGVVDSTIEPGEASYSFQGLSGSLDHVLANDIAREIVTGADIWNINAEEGVMLQYSRYNYNVTDLWDPTVPFASSDHNPEVIGLDVVPDLVGPAVTVEKALGQRDPAPAKQDVRFTVTFSEPVTGFTVDDMTFSGTGGVVPTIDGAGAVYTVTFEAVKKKGTLTLSVAAGAVSDAAGNPSTASTSSDNSVEIVPPGHAEHVE